MFSCKASSTIPIAQTNEVDSIVIMHIDTKEKHILTDKDKINRVLSDYLETAKRKPVKFIASYRVTVITGKKEDKYLIVERYLNSKGITYKMQNDFSEFIATLKASE